MCYDMAGPPVVDRHARCFSIPMYRELLPVLLDDISSDVKFLSYPEGGKNMLLTRWEPFGNTWKEMNRLQREMNRVFDSYGLAGDGFPGLAVSYPALNIWHDEKAVYAEAELPGMDLNDLEIYVT